MKHLLPILLVITLCAAASAQTIRTLGYNTTNGQVIANTGTNVLTFTNDEIRFIGGEVRLLNASIYYESTPVLDVEERSLHGGWISFGSLNLYGGELTFEGTNAALNAAATRTNLGLGWSALTNTNASTSLLGYTTNGQVIANTGTNVLTFTNSLSIKDHVSGSTLDFVFTDEALNSGYGDGDYAIGVGAYGVAIKYGPSESEWGQAILVQEGNGDVVYPSHWITFIQPIGWDNTANAAITRTNLGLPLPALTNTSNVTMMRALAGSTNTNEPYSGTVDTDSAFILTISNGIIVSVTPY